MTIVIHTRPGCPYCTRALDFLDARKLPYQVVEHDNWDERQSFYDGLGLEANDRTVPQIFIDDQRIGGYGHLVHHKLFAGAES